MRGNLLAVPSFVNNRAWIWLIFSILVFIVLKLVRSVIRFLLVLFVILLVVYLAYYHQEMISSLLSK